MKFKQTFIICLSLWGITKQFIPLSIAKPSSLLIHNPQGITNSNSLGSPSLIPSTKPPPNTGMLIHNINITSLSNSIIAQQKGNNPSSATSVKKNATIHIYNSLESIFHERAIPSLPNDANLLLRKVSKENFFYSSTQTFKVDNTNINLLIPNTGSIFKVTSEQIFKNSLVENIFHHSTHKYGITTLKSMLLEDSIAGTYNYSRALFNDTVIKRNHNNLLLYEKYYENNKLGLVYHEANDISTNKLYYNRVKSLNAYSLQSHKNNRTTLYVFSYGKDFALLKNNKMISLQGSNQKFKISQYSYYKGKNYGFIVYFQDKNNLNKLLTYKIDPLEYTQQFKVQAFVHKSTISNYDYKKEVYKLQQINIQTGILWGITKQVNFKQLKLAKINFSLKPEITFSHNKLSNSKQSRLSNDLYFGYTSNLNISAQLYDYIKISLGYEINWNYHHKEINYEQEYIKISINI